MFEFALQEYANGWLDDITVSVQYDPSDDAIPAMIFITGIRSAIFKDDPAEWHQIADEFIQFIHQRSGLNFTKGKMINNEGEVGITLVPKE